jgi:hypothetical protein
VALALRMYFLRRNAMPDPDGIVLGPATIELAADGIHHHRADSNSLTGWRLLRDLTTTREHLFLWVDRMAAHIIPVRELQGGVLEAVVGLWLFIV